MNARRYVPIGQHLQWVREHNARHASEALPGYVPQCSGVGCWLSTGDYATHKGTVRTSLTATYCARWLSPIDPAWQFRAQCNGPRRRVLRCKKAT